MNGLYQVSNTGRIRSLKFKNANGTIDRIKILKLNNRNGYLTIQLSKETKRRTFQVSRLVAQAFIPNPKNYPVVNHIDYNKQNNNVDNLEWCTQLQNVHYSIQDMRKTLKDKKYYGIYCRKRNRKNKYEVSLRKVYYGTYETLDEAIKKRDEALNELNIAI